MNTKLVSFRLDEYLLDLVDMAAAGSSRSRSFVLNRLIESGLNQPFRWATEAVPSGKPANWVETVPGPSPVKDSLTTPPTNGGKQDIATLRAICAISDGKSPVEKLAELLTEAHAVPVINGVRWTPPETDPVMTQYKVDYVELSGGKSVPAEKLICPKCNVLNLKVDIDTPTEPAKAICPVCETEWTFTHTNAGHR